MIRFSTLSGVLEAKRDPEGRVILDLPLNPPQPVTRGQHQGLVDIASCGLPVQEVRLCGTTKKMLVRLEVGDYLLILNYTSFSDLLHSF